LDDCLHALQPSIQHLARSSIHLCLQRNGISRLPDVGGDKLARAALRPRRLGTYSLTDQQRLDLLDLFEKHHQRRSTIITTQLPVSGWHRMIG
jgi:hypothetical protein